MRRIYTVREAERWRAWVERAAENDCTAAEFRVLFGLTLTVARQNAAGLGVTIPPMETSNLRARSGRGVPVPRIDGGPRPAVPEPPYRKRVS